MAENDHLLGNFSAKQIHAIGEAKNSVTHFVQESSSNVEKMNEKSEFLK
jgi:hypothetical protein